MLIACHDCGRQFDVTHLDPGTTVRCACGLSLDVEHREGHDPRAVRCSGCGGPLEDGQRECQFCGCEVTLEERRLSEICPVCFARMASGANFCMECGIEIQPQKVTTVPAASDCPRCESTLRARVVGTTSVVECSHCGGLWLNPDCFERVTDEAERQESGAFLAAFPSTADRPTVDTSDVQYLPCLVCGERMTRRNFAIKSGVIIDLCRDHGVWLDHSELEQIIQFIRGGGMVAARKAEMRHLRDQVRQASHLPGYTPEVMLGDRRTVGDMDVLQLLGWVATGIGRLLRR